MRKNTLVNSIIFLLLILSIPLNPPVKAQEPEPIVYRGINYIDTDFRNGTYAWQSASQYVYDGNEYVPYVFEQVGTHYRIQSGLIGAEIYRDRAVFYSPDMEHLTVGRETWLVYRRVGGDWVPVCASLTPYFQSSDVSLGEEDINVTGTWSTSKGTLSVEYSFREYLKHTVTWTPTQPGSYAIVQVWNETHYTDVSLENKTIIRRTKDSVLGKADSLTFLFHDDNQPFGVFEDQYSARDMLHKTIFAKGTGNYQGIPITDGVAWIFFNSSKSVVNASESIVVDPTTVSLNNPTVDGEVSRVIIGGALTKSTVVFILRMRLTGTTLYRSFAEWDISSIVDGSIITDVDFLYDGETHTASGDCHIHEMLGARPSTAATADIWTEMGEGTVYVNPAGFPVVAENQQVDLGATAVSDLQAQLTAGDWFAIGMTLDDEGTASEGSLYSEDDATPVPPPTLYVTYTLPYPSITSASITDLDDTDNCYEMKQYYTFQAVLETPNGADTISNVSLRIMNEAVVLTQVNASTLDGVPAYAIVTGGTLIDLDGASCSWGEAGTTGTLTLKIRFEWDFVDIANLELSVFIMNELGHSAGWTEMASDYFDVIGRLVTSGLASNVTYVPLSDPIQITGTVYYSTSVTGNTPSTFYPPDAQFTAVRIQNAAHAVQGSDTSVTNGAFVVDFAIPGAIGTYVYHVYLEMVPDYVDGDAPDGDTVTVYGISAPLLLPFDDETGAIAYDWGGSNNDGLIVGPTRTGIGLYGRALEFDGVNDYVIIDDSASLNITDELRISAWIYTGDTGVQGILVKDGSYGLSVISNYAIRLTINTTNTDTGPNVFSALTWTHITGTYDGFDVNIYIDGDLTRTAELTGPISLNKTDIYIGNLTTNFFNGTIDEVQITDLSADWWDLDWRFRRRITFNNSLSAENLGNFTVLIHITDTNIDWADVQANGEDLRFVDSDDTTEMDYEIEKWDDTNDAWVWVQVPQIDALSTTDYIWMYYDNSGAADGQDVEGTWDDYFVMVQHFEEWNHTSNDARVNNNETVVTDSTANDNDGGFYWVDTAGLVGWWAFEDGNASTTVTDLSGEGNTGTWTGKAVGDMNVTVSYDGLGDAGYFDATNDYIQSPSFNITGNGMTILAWIYPYEVDTWDQASVVTKVGAIPASYCWKIGLTNIGQLRADIWNYAGTPTSPAGGTIPVNTWTQIGVVVNEDTQEVITYINSVESVNTPWAGGDINTYNLPIRIGWEQANNRFFNGSIDDVIIYNRTLSPSEILVHYQQWDQSYPMDGVINGQEYGPYVNVTNSATLNVTADITLEGWVYGDILNFADEDDAHFDDWRMNGYTLINEGDEVYLHSIGYNTTDTRLSPNVTVTQASDYYEYEFYIDNDREESNPSLTDGGSDADEICVYDDTEAFWTNYSIGAGNYNISVAEDTTLEIKGTSCLNATITNIGAGGYSELGVYHTYGGGQDWSSQDFVGLYLYGANSAETIRVFLNDTDGDSQYWDITDNYAGWRRHVLPIENPTAETLTFDPSKVDTILIYDPAVGAAFIWYLDRVVVDVGQWVQVEFFIPDTLFAGGTNVYTRSWTGAAWSGQWWSGEIVGGNIIGEGYTPSNLYFLDGTLMSDVQPNGGEAFYGEKFYYLGQRDIIKAGDGAASSPASITYSSLYGCLNRIGFSLKMPPDDGQDSSIDGISQTSLRLHINYLNSGATTPQMPPLIYKEDCYYLDIYNGSARMGIHNVTGWWNVTGSTELTDDTWEYLAGTYENGTINIYLDGSLEATDTVYGTIQFNTNNVFLGANGTSPEDPLWTIYDEFRISNTTRSADWIEAQHLSMINTYATYGTAEPKSDSPLTPSISIVMYAPIASFPYNLMTSITDMDCTDWVFVGNGYHFVGVFVRQNASYPLTDVSLMFTDGVTWTIATFDLVNDVWNLTSNGAYTMVNSNSSEGNAFTAIWELYIGSGMFDELDVDLLLYCVDNTTASDGYEIVEADYFNIYNVGGLEEYEYSGDGTGDDGGGFSVLGEGVFGLAASNSSLPEGSWAYANITWRKLQHVGFLVHIWQNTQYDAINNYWNCPSEHAETATVSYGIDYWYNGSWMTGWSVQLEVIAGAAGTYGWGGDEAWVQVNATWYNGGIAVDWDSFFAFYEAIEPTDSSTQFALRVDMWVGIEEGSSKVAGRVRPEYFGMNETGWGPWANWRPIAGLEDEAVFFDDLLDQSGDVISAGQLELFIAWANLTKVFPDAGDPDCDNHLWALIDYDGPHWRTLFPTDMMVGISSPIVPDAITPGEVSLGFFTSLITAMIDGITKPILGALGGGVTALYFFTAGVIDSAFEFFGIVDFMSSITAMILAYGAYFATSMANLILIVVQIFRILTSVSTTLIDWLTRMISFLIQLGTIVSAILNGTQTGIGSLIDVWDLFEVNEWIDFIPIAVFISWVNAIDNRARKMGGGWMSIFIGDLQMASWVISFMVDWFSRILNFVIDRVFAIMNAISVKLSI